jgi:hypothetical protein
MLHETIIEAKEDKDITGFFLNKTDSIFDLFIISSAILPKIFPIPQPKNKSMKNPIKLGT